MRLITVVLVPLLMLPAAAVCWFWWRRRLQIRFIRKTLSHGCGLNRDRRVIAALSTLPDRIVNLEPTIRCLLNQTRPPDEIVIAVPQFSRRQRKRYVITERI